MIYPHVATLWHKIGEVDRKAQWERTVIDPARVDEVAGAYRNIGGDITAYSADILLPGVGDLAIKEQDRICKGKHDTDNPPVDAWTISKVEPISIDRTIHHLEVYAS